MDLKEKIKAKEDLVKELSKCRRCRFCVDACEVYLVAEKNEVMSAYGRVQLLRFMLDGVFGSFKLDDSVVYPIYSCLQCGRCTVTCKSKGQNLEVSELIRLGRSFLNKELL